MPNYRGSIRPDVAVDRREKAGVVRERKFHCNYNVPRGAKASSQLTETQLS